MWRVLSRTVRNRVYATTAATVAFAYSSTCTTSPIASKNVDAPEWREVDLSNWPLDHHLLHNSLKGEGKVEHYRLFIAPDLRSIRAEITLGHQVCGHPSIVHGGTLAAVFDDTFGALFVASRLGNGFTANLSVNYRKPVLAGTPLVLEGRIDRVEVGKSGSRKVFFVGTLRNSVVPETVYTEATAIFIVKSVPSSDDFVKSTSLKEPST
jgi:acyl-coenzyme A thioesterase PaaI-like protein